MRWREQNCDVLIVGAGPAGLTAAVYLARYRRRVLVVHDETSRAARITLTRNVPGFPGGVAGPELLQRMREQAQLYGADIRRDCILALQHQNGGFQALGDDGTYRARSVILATGVTLNEVDLPKTVHEEALQCACLRYCPICDGFEAARKVVAVLGSSTDGAREALFLREYTEQVTLLAQEACELSEAQRRELAAAGVQVRDAPAVEIRPDATGMQVTLAMAPGSGSTCSIPPWGASPVRSWPHSWGSGFPKPGAYRPTPIKRLRCPVSTPPATSSTRSIRLASRSVMARSPPPTRTTGCVGRTAACCRRRKACTLVQHSCEHRPTCAPARPWGWRPTAPLAPPTKEALRWPNPNRQASECALHPHCGPPTVTPAEATGAPRIPRGVLQPR